LAHITRLHAREVLDSRGNPTVETEVTLADGAWGRAMVPSGASTGKAEALELRDGDPFRYLGRGVLRAVANVQAIIAPALVGMDAVDQRAIDQRLISLDGTANKRRLGANALLGVSLAVAHASAASAGLPLYRHLGGAPARELPVPVVNIMSGGIHGGGNIDFQDYQIIPLRARRYSEALCDVAAVYAATRTVLKSRSLFRPGVADEGGYAPALETNEQGFEVLVQAMDAAGLAPGRGAAIAIDVAASHFFEHGVYRLAAEGREYTARQMVDRLEEWVARYPILSIEDGLAEDDWEGWKLLTERLGKRCQLVGDDLFVTHPHRLNRGIAEGIANAVLVKMNQIGTLTETLDVIALADSHGYRRLISARSGETEDDTMADLAVATCAGQLKVGAITRSERLAKYNRLLRIEEELGPAALYRGAEVFKDWRKA
jgi:enolase 1/2/3